MNIDLIPTGDSPPDNLNVIIDQKKIVILRLFDSEIALAGTVPFSVMKVPNLESCFTPASIRRHLQRLSVGAAMHYHDFRDTNSLFGETLKTKPQQFRPAYRRDDCRHRLRHSTRFIQKLEARLSALAQIRAAASV